MKAKNSVQEIHSDQTLTEKEAMQLATTYAQYGMLEASKLSLEGFYNDKVIETVTQYIQKRLETGGQ